MDRQTYNVLSQRLDYLELVANIYKKDKDINQCTSYLTRLTIINENLNKFISAKYPEFFRIIDILKQHNLWKDKVPLGSMDTNEKKDSVFVKSQVLDNRKFIILSNYEYLVDLIENLQKLSNLNPHDILSKRFPVEVVNHRRLIKNLNEMLANEVVPKQFNRLLVNSISFLEIYVTTINDFNIQFNEIRQKLVDINVKVAKKQIETKNRLASETY